MFDVSHTVSKIRTYERVQNLTRRQIHAAAIVSPYFPGEKPRVSRTNNLLFADFPV